MTIYRTPPPLHYQGTLTVLIGETAHTVIDHYEHRFDEWRPKDGAAS